MEESRYSISIITAVYNAENSIGFLIESLRNQLDKDFEWIVVDGESTDNTLNILKSVNDLNIKIISEPDFGIYDALNKGIKFCSGDYYLVAGADDLFFENAIKDYRNSICLDDEMITALVVKDGIELCPSKEPSWRVAQNAFISCHALGVLIKKELHEKFGFYSKKFPIAADQLFIKTCGMNGVRIKVLNIRVGNFGSSGVSSEDIIGTCMEIFRIQILTEKRKWLIYILFVFKLYRRLKLLR